MCSCIFLLFRIWTDNIVAEQEKLHAGVHQKEIFNYFSSLSDDRIYLLDMVCNEWKSIFH